MSGTSQPSSWFLIPWEYIYRNILLNLSWDVDDLCLGFNLAQIPSYRATGKKTGQCSLTAPQHCGEPSSPSLQDYPCLRQRWQHQQPPPEIRPDKMGQQPGNSQLPCIVTLLLPARHVKPSSKLKDDCKLTTWEPFVGNSFLSYWLWMSYVMPLWSLTQAILALNFPDYLTGRLMRLISSWKSDLSLKRCHLALAAFTCKSCGGLKY